MADLSRVFNGTAPIDYLDPTAFFAKSYPTRGHERAAQSGLFQWVQPAGRPTAGKSVYIFLSQTQQLLARDFEPSMCRNRGARDGELKTLTNARRWKEIAKSDRLSTAQIVSRSREQMPIFCHLTRHGQSVEQHFRGQSVYSPTNSLVCCGQGIAR